MKPLISMVLTLGALALVACGENSPATEAEHSPAVSEPVEGVPPRASEEAQGQPRDEAESVAQSGS